MINLQISQKVQKRRKRLQTRIPEDQKMPNKSVRRIFRKKRLMQQILQGVPFHQKKPRQMSIPILVKMRKKAAGSKM